MNNSALAQDHGNQQQYAIFDASQSMEIDNSQLEYDGHTSHTAQAAPITVQWLIDNFEPAEGCSLRRSTLYNYYIHHCNEQKIETVNPASFGKLIRSVFLGLRTRRLGTRGNSKYHYYGIRVKINSLLNQLTEDHALAIRNHPMSLSPSQTNQSSAIFNQPRNHHYNQNDQIQRRIKGSSFHSSSNFVEFKPIISPIQVQVNLNEQQQHQHQLHQNHYTEGLIHPIKINFDSSSENQNGLLKTAKSDKDKNLNKVGLVVEANQIPEFGHVNTENIELPSNCSLEDVKMFEEMYKNHCEKLLDSVIGLKLESIKDIWFVFWRFVPDNLNEEKMLSSKLFALCELTQVVDFVKNCDYLFYQFCIEILIPDVLGALPHTLVQSIRSLSKNVHNWLSQALVNVPDQMKQSKLSIISKFSMNLRRYTSLNHLAQTVKNSLQNEQILAQMLVDINRVDFNYIREQAKWTCGCSDRVMTKLENEFKESLRNHGQWSLEGWIAWLDSNANLVLREYEGSDKFKKMSRQFLLKWSFVSSSIVRDLTLRSASTFGSFHLIRLLLDEYLCYWIERKLACMFKQTPLAVISDLELKNSEVHHFE